MPQSARLSAGRGLQSLFGQCPNRSGANFKGASLTWPELLLPCDGRYGGMSSGQGVGVVKWLVRLGW